MSDSTGVCPTLLVVVAPTRPARRLLDEIHRLGWRSIVASQPLEVIIRLQSSSGISVILAPECETHFKTREMFRFARDEFPLVRRITYRMPQATHEVGDEGSDDMLRLPLPPHRLRSAIGAPEANAARLPAPARGHDERTAEELLSAWHASSDSHAFDELDRRYRQHIHQDAVSRGYSAADADDIAQDTLLGVFLSRPSRRAPNALFSALTTTSCAALERRHGRRSRLGVAVAAEARIRRREMESRSRPDARLWSDERTTRARAAVAGLPGLCRLPFSLCAVNGMTAQQAGANLDMFPATVNMWLRRARQLIASDLAASSVRQA
jgi:DNA-directed RNA polymerase specialized sigma24 family protein